MILTICHGGHLLGRLGQKSKFIQQKILNIIILNIYLITESESLKQATNYFLIITYFNKKPE